MLGACKYVGNYKGAKPVFRLYFPTYCAVLAILWGNQQAPSLLQVYFSPQKSQYPLFCGEITRREACSRFTFPHKNRSTHNFVGKSQGSKPALGSFFPTKHAAPTIMWGKLLYTHHSFYSIYNIAKKRDFLQKFHKKSKKIKNFI